MYAFMKFSREYLKSRSAQSLSKTWFMSKDIFHKTLNTYLISTKHKLKNCFE